MISQLRFDRTRKPGSPPGCLSNSRHRKHLLVGLLQSIHTLFEVDIVGRELRL